jgi:hypothetical protein
MSNNDSYRTRDRYVRLPDGVELCDSPWLYAVDVTEEVAALRAELDDAVGRVADLEQALRLIAAPMRADGTWNRDREACRQVATEALHG